MSVLAFAARNAPAPVGPRQIAMALGKLTFEGGRCERGHGTTRHVFDSSCVECTRLENIARGRRRGRGKRGKAKQAEYKAAHLARNPGYVAPGVIAARIARETVLLPALTCDALALAAFVYIEAGITAHEKTERERERNREAARRDREANPEKYRERERKRERDPLDVIARSYAYRARKRNAEGSYSADDLRRIVAEHGGLCAYCPAPYEHIDHMTPLSRGGSNWPGNLQPLCGHHNDSKLWRTDAEFRVWKGWPAFGRCIT